VVGLQCHHSHEAAVVHDGCFTKEVGLQLHETKLRL
jgi:hypothetical protein